MKQIFKDHFVSVIIPSQSPAQYFVSEILPSFAKQTIQRFEIIVVSDDKFLPKKSPFCKSPWLKTIVVNPELPPSQKRNIGAKSAIGDILAFLDDDAFVPSRWIDSIIKQFINPSVNIACGPGIIPLKTSFWESVFDSVLSVPFGSGSLTFRFIKSNKRFVDDYPTMNFTIRKSVFENVGGFNSRYWPGEDSKFCESLVYGHGYRIHYNPDLYVYHHRKNNPASYLMQHARYGYHRGLFFAQGDKNSQHLTYLLPMFFVGFHVLIFATVIANGQLFRNPYVLFVFLSPFMFYVGTSMAVALYALYRGYSIFVSICSLFVGYLTHLVYGTSFLGGLLAGIIIGIKTQFDMFKIRSV